MVESHTPGFLAFGCLGRVGSLGSKLCGTDIKLMLGKFIRVILVEGEVEHDAELGMSFFCPTAGNSEVNDPSELSVFGVDEEPDLCILSLEAITCHLVMGIK